MPRRRALTPAQLAGLLALSATEAELAHHWVLGDADLAVVGRRRRDHNRLGFALQLCALRYPGRPPRPSGNSSRSCSPIRASFRRRRRRSRRTR